MTGDMLAVTAPHDQPQFTPPPDAAVRTWRVERGGHGKQARPA